MRVHITESGTMSRKTAAPGNRREELGMALASGIHLPLSRPAMPILPRCGDMGFSMMPDWDTGDDDDETCPPHFSEP